LIRAVLVGASQKTNKAKQERGAMPLRIPAERPSTWHATLTLDVIVKAAKQTVFHPFVAWMLPLCLLAVSTPYHYLSVRITAAYAILLTTFSVASLVNKRIAFGPAREVDVSEEVVVITGGASGLGLTIADFYRMRGAGVAVLDVKPVPNDDSTGVEYFKCDVGSAEEVAAVAKDIRSSVGSSIPSRLFNSWS
jgi:uncharacterized membrane protein